ncbi:InlB B-repeat-containing protein [[Ruminococcus] lactaris]|uniref:InlB B-repeat-containing protein n=1 Tax=[Ruminococcus] lactaris TaxID=46228 RepID=UPI00351FB2A0
MKKMKKMKKQFLSLFVLLCMIISMFPTTALAANIDVSGKVTVDRVYEEPTCADNLYYGEVNVNGSATESKTRLTHTVLPLIQWQYGNNTYQIIPSAYKYYVCNINDPNHILEGIEGSEGSSTLSGWPGTYKCYQTVVTTDGVTNGTATFDIDLAYQFSRLNSSIGWTYASNWGGRTLHFTIKQTVAYTVTYTDGVEDEEVFADDVHENLSSGVATPAFSGGTPTRTGYVFKGWNPEVAATVTGNATYVATWGEDKNNNGIDDNEETKYTVTYKDGVDGEVFADDVHGNLLSGVATPAFSGGTPTRTGYVFKGWNPAVAATVTGNATYVATWGEDKNNNGIDDNEETKYTVTYTDGVDGKEIFADQVYGNLLPGVDTPAFKGTPTREGYVFKGWNPEVAATVTGNATYIATWGEDKNNNGIADDEETKYTVRYTDGVDGKEVFADQVYGNLLSGVATPAFEGTPTREGYVFKGWNPAVAATVTGNVTYVATWGEDKNNNGIDDNEETKYTVTYKDGVDGEEVFADQVYGNLLSGVATPAFEGTPTRTGYVFKGWNPEVAATVTGNATYVARWAEDKNNNGIADDEETKYTVRYTDGVDEEVIFADQVYRNLLSGVDTPAFKGTPKREGYVFKGWNPAVAEKVTGDATYAATWGEDKNNNGIDDNEETKYTVTYKDGVDGEVFADQVYGNLLSGVATPAFEGTPTREGYVFKGWEPSVAEKVTGDVTYVAVWEKAKDNNGDTKPGDTKPGDTKPGNTKPGNTKPGNTKPNTTTNSSTKAGTSARSPKTSDTANLALWMALLVVSGGSMVINKKKKYNR